MLIAEVSMDSPTASSSLPKAPSTPPPPVVWTKIRDLYPSSSNKPNVQFIVLEKLDTVSAHAGERVCKVLIADETAAMHMSLWNEYIDIVKESDILRLHSG
jgi:hypothetical protein